MDWVQAKATANGGWTREQLAEWGVPWPPPKGWKKELLRKTSATTGNESYSAAIARLWVERKSVGSARTKRLEFLLRWSLVRVAHKQEYQKRRRCTSKSWRRFMDSKCWVCHREKATARHHIIQVQHGGGNDDRNIVPICEGCHSEVHPWMDASAHPMVKEAKAMDTVPL